VDYGIQEHAFSLVSIHLAASFHNTRKTRGTWIKLPISTDSIGGNLANTPWLAYTDPHKMANVVDRVRRLEPSIVVPYHGPVVRGQIDKLCTQLLSMPVDETIVFPSQDAFNSLYPDSDELNLLLEAHGNR
jgi:hypothetical protein